VSSGGIGLIADPAIMWTTDDGCKWQSS